MLNVNGWFTPGWAVHREIAQQWGASRGNEGWKCGRGPAFAYG